jgi:hypothetical protein
VSGRAESHGVEGNGDLGLSAGRASHGDRSAEPGRILPGGPASTPASVEWTINPWREDPLRATLAAIAALLLWLLAAWLLPGEGLLSTFMGVAVLVVLAPGMIPTQCHVDGDGVARRVLFAWERKAWPAILRARVSVHGLFVSPFAQRSRPLLEALRQELGRHGL